MTEPIWIEEYKINSFLVNPQQRLGIYALLNLLQDTAWHHATHLGFGYEATLEKNAFWVLTRQILSMKEWPSWGQEVQIQTWVRPPEGVYVIRDFEIHCKGLKLGECSTTWILLNQETRKPMRNGPEIFLPFARKDHQLKLEMKKIEVEGELVSLSEFQVRNSDLDMHEHVNNTKYSQWILDSIPMEWHSKFQLHQYEINFLSEAKSNDLITVKKSKDPVIQDHLLTSQFVGIRSTDQKLIFTAQLQVQEK